MKKTIHLILLILISKLLICQTVIYPYRVEPTKFPDYHKRSFLAPTPAESFNDTIRFVGSRYTEPKKEFMFYGNFYRPNQGWIFNQSYFEFYADILSMKKQNIGVFDPAGYGPGTPYTGSFGQRTIPKNKLDMLNELGPMFIGNSLGEQDGRYWADQRQLMEPYSRNPKIQHTIFLDYLRQNAKDYGYKLTQLTTFWGFHYLPKDGYVSAVGSECQNKDRVSQIQVQYAFNRGISRQYGIINFGDVSVFNTWGYKDNPADPYGGNSFALMRRMMFLQYQYNSWILGFEGGWGTVENPEPIGKIQIGMYNLVNEHFPQPGNLHAPVAFLTDFFSGWMPPYQGAYLKWGFLPYDRGQYLTHYLFDLVYPNYQNNGQNKDETPAISANVNGDVDAILSDIQQELLLQYPVVVLADELFTDLCEVKDKLDFYVREGGNLVLTAVNAKKLFRPESFSDYESIAAGAAFTYKSTTITESNAFRLCSCDLTGIQTIATVAGKPAVIEYKKGKGKYTILLTDYGLNTSAGKPGILLQTQIVIGDKMKEQMLFSVNKELTCTVNIFNDTTFIVGIYNNTLTQQNFFLESKIGIISSTEELPVGEDLTQQKGYKPVGGTVVFGENSSNTIRALDVRLFKVIVKMPVTKIIPEVNYPVLPENKFLAIKNLPQAKNIISGMPHFFYHFTGIKVDWKELGDAETKAFKENVVWLNHHKMEMVIDFCETFPLVDFRPENVLEYNSLTQKLLNIKANLDLFEGRKIIVLPEPKNQLEYTGLTQLRTICNSMGFGILTKSLKSAGGNASIYDGTEKSIENAALIYVEHTDSLINMKPLNAVFRNTPVVLNSTFQNWDSIYVCLDAISREANFLVGKKDSLPTDKNLSVSSANVNKYVSFHDIQSLKTEILNHQDDFFGFFEGVKIDGTYLWNLSEEACIEEGRWLSKHKVKVIVDLIRELNHYPNLTWTKELNSYGQGKAMMDNILLKMDLLGSKDIIIGSHMRCELWSTATYTNSSSIKTGMKVFINAAKERGITVHIQHREYQNYPGRLLASPTETKSLVDEFSGTRFAANLGIVTNETYLTGIAGNKLGLVIIAYKGDASLDCRNPLYKGMYNKLKPDYKSVSRLGVPMILDAEYENWNEVILDCDELGWTRIN